MRVECENCGKHFCKRKGTVEKYKHHFCSRECYHKYRREHPEEILHGKCDRSLQNKLKEWSKIYANNKLSRD